MGLGNSGNSGFGMVGISGFGNSEISSFGRAGISDMGTRDSRRLRRSSIMDEEATIESKIKNEEKLRL